MVLLHDKRESFFCHIIRKMWILKVKKQCKKAVFWLFIVQERKWATDDGCTGKADTGNADEGQRL
ncbi:hypothetical protein D3Z47_12530 [Lachnospiraceae bacterium]|nr:hypothetical protein [Lachnospiraceae bacterium]